MSSSCFLCSLFTLCLLLSLISSLTTRLKILLLLASSQRLQMVVVDWALLEPGVKYLIKAQTQTISVKFKLGWVLLLLHFGDFFTLSKPILNKNLFSWWKRKKLRPLISLWCLPIFLENYSFVTRKISIWLTLPQNHTKKNIHKINH